jgi:hypothetical protein
VTYECSFDLRARLREVIAALDRRVRQPGRHTEAAIAAEAAALRREAENRIAALDRKAANASSREVSSSAGG